MNEIAAMLGVTKAALYKHYTSKQEILDSIVERMNQMDEERAKEYEMPEGSMEEVIKGYQNTAFEKIQEYTKAQFDHWTKEDFSSTNLQLDENGTKAAAVTAAIIPYIIFMLRADNGDLKTSLCLLFFEKIHKMDSGSLFFYLNTILNILTK